MPSSAGCTSVMQPSIRSKAAFSIISTTTCSIREAVFVTARSCWLVIKVARSDCLVCGGAHLGSDDSRAWRRITADVGYSLEAPVNASRSRQRLGATAFAVGGWRFWSEASARRSRLLWLQEAALIRKAERAEGIKLVAGLANFGVCGNVPRLIFPHAARAAASIQAVPPPAHQHPSVMRGRITHALTDSRTFKRPGAEPRGVWRAGQAWSDLLVWPEQSIGSGAYPD